MGSDLLYWLAVHRWAGLLLCLIFCVAWTCAQNVPAKLLFPPNYPYLLRLERRELYANSCVLVKTDGNFHYEHIRSVDRVTVLEGILSPEALARLTALLQRPDLVNIRQEDVPEPLIPFGDEIQVNVFRRDHWQDLVFPDSKDRKGLAPTVDVLVDWLATVPSLSQRQRTEFEGRNNCLTERKIELHSRRLPPPVVWPPNLRAAMPALLKFGSIQANDPQLAPPIFLLRMTIDRMGDPMQRICALVYSDGRYHAENSTQSSDEDETLRSQVMEGVLPSSELQSLRQILNAPEWRVEYREQTPPGVFIRSGEFVRLQIPGPGGIKHSLFANLEFAPPPGGTEAENNDLAAFPRSHLALLAPLREWFKREVEDAQLPPVKDVPATNCKPPG
jgi:hypothetical protein